MCGGRSVETSKRIEILITADVLDYGDEDEKILQEEINDELEKCILDLSGEISRKGMIFYLENLEHEVAFETEGTYEYKEKSKDICNTCSKHNTPECKGNTMTIFKGLKVVCSGYSNIN